uniref:Gamma-glutamyltransferase n=1 Tax=Macrostomum lignano TaxID=282301 RepID=A0A1I8J739_9PLAT
DRPWLKDTVSDQELVTYRRYGVTSDATQLQPAWLSSDQRTHNGNAMDAAVTTVLCVGVTNFHSNGIGGGSFLMHYNSCDHVQLPGVAGLHRAHSRHGRLRWSDLVKRVADLLRSGVEVTKPLVQAIPSVNSVKESALYKAVRNPATGAFYAAGETFTDEKLARTFDTIANDPMSFYNGQLADDIVKEISEAGGKVTKEDLRQYNVAEPDPISVELDESGLRLYSMPPPSAMLKNPTWAMLDTENMAVLVANLTSKLLAAETRSKIFDNATQDVEYYGPSYKQFTDSGTTHVSLVDSEGNAVVDRKRAFYTTIKWRTSLGGISATKTIIQYRLRRRNYIKPGKRPMSSAAPVFITEQSSDQLRYIGGAAGGSLITSALTSVLARLIYLKQNVKEATDAFRLHHELSPNDIQYWNKSNHKSVVEIMQRLPDGSWQTSGDYRKAAETAGN